MQDFAPSSTEAQTLVVMRRQESHNTIYSDPAASLPTVSHPDYVCFSYREEHYNLAPTSPWTLNTP